MGGASRDSGKNVFVGLNRWSELAEVGRLDSALAFFSSLLRDYHLHHAVAILGISLPVFKNPLLSQWLQNQGLVKASFNPQSLKASRYESPAQVFTFCLFYSPPPFFYPSYVSSCVVFLLSLLDNLSCVQFSVRFPHSCAHRTPKTPP